MHPANCDIRTALRGEVMRLDSTSALEAGLAFPSLGSRPSEMGARLLNGGLITPVHSPNGGGRRWEVPVDARAAVEAPAGCPSRPGDGLP